MLLAVASQQPTGGANRAVIVPRLSTTAIEAEECSIDALAAGCAHASPPRSQQRSPFSPVSCRRTGASHHPRMRYRKSTACTPRLLKRRLLPSIRPTTKRSKPTTSKTPHEGAASSGHAFFGAHPRKARRSALDPRPLLASRGGLQNRAVVAAGPPATDARVASQRWAEVMPLRPWPHPRASGRPRWIPSVLA